MHISRPSANHETLRAVGVPKFTAKIFIDYLKVCKATPMFDPRSLILEQTDMKYDREEVGYSRRQEDSSNPFFFYLKA